MTMDRKYSEADQLTLGRLVAALEKMDPSKELWFDWNQLSVRGLASYRGYYDQLAIGFTEGNGWMVHDLLLACEAAVGEEFNGYKGGSFQMGPDTRLYVANWGRSGGVGLVGVDVYDYGVELRTAIVDSLYKHD